MYIPSKQQRATPAQTASILVGSSVVFAIWIVVVVSINTPHQTATLQLMIVLLSGIATVLLCGLLSESHRRAQRELDLAAKQAKLEATNLQLEESRQQAEQASAAKSLFLANMSHELKTPLNAIIGFSEVIKNQTMGPAGAKNCAEYAEGILSSGHHLFELIGNVLDISKLEAGKMTLDEGVVEIAALVKTSVARLSQRGKDKRITLETDLLQEAPVIRGDELKLKQVLLNLLSNAIKFTPEKGCVTIRSELARNGDLAIVVSDTGIGMSPDEIAIALEPFGQVDNGLAKLYEGTGIGLPLAKRLVELHGGKLVIESVRDAGTTICVLLPADRLVAPREVARVMSPA